MRRIAVHKHFVQRAWHPWSQQRASIHTTSVGCDVAVIGGGVIGSSVALHIVAAAPHQRVVVFEPDSSYKWASAPRSAGGIRQQFSLKVNIELSIYGIEFLKSTLPQLCQGVDVDPDVQFRENGYLILAPQGKGATCLRENVAVQHATGASWIQLLDPPQLKSKFPWLSTDGIALGAFGSKNEGYFDPWSLLQALRKCASARGVSFVSQQVVGFNRGSKGEIMSVRLADGSAVPAASVVNAAGAYSGNINSMLGADVAPLPVVPRKRCMWLFHCKADKASDAVTPRPPANTPLTVDSSGVYFRSEGSPGRFVCGVSPKPEDDKDSTLADIENADADLFESTVWPALANRAPALESLRVESSWAGFYEYNLLDQNGIVGWHPDVPNLLLATGFSGHGLQQSPGVGRACTELLLHGKFQTIDLSSLCFERVLQNKPVYEQGIY